MSVSLNFFFKRLIDIDIDNHNYNHSLLDSKSTNVKNSESKACKRYYSTNKWAAVNKTKSCE